MDPPDKNSPIASSPPFVQVVSDVAGLPAPLLGDPKRRAVAPISGYVYQAWWSIDAWLRLTGPDEIIYLEGAEDFDVGRQDGATTVQVRRTGDPLSLANKKALEALENFWSLSVAETSRPVEYHYLTTSSVAKERDAQFLGLSGIEAWRAARTNNDLAAKVSSYLTTKLAATSPLRAFLTTATPEAVQGRLLQRFHWLTDQSDLDGVQRSVTDRIAVILHNQQRSVSLVAQVQKWLISRFWELIVLPTPGDRRLTFGDLLQLVLAATTANLPIPLDRLAELIGNAPPGLALLNLLIQKTPIPPQPLLLRPALTVRLEDLFKQRAVVLVTGTVHKGKSTLAQLVATALCPTAWWVNLTDRRPSEVDNVLLALSGRIEAGDCPNLVIIDDLDIGPTAHRAYKDSLALFLHRAHSTGRAVLLTARGASSEAAVVQDFGPVQLFDVPEVGSGEAETLCTEHGCPPAFAKLWGFFVATTTRGHPKLVQVRLAELAARGWPQPSAEDLTAQSAAVNTAQHLARQILRETVSNPVAEFVYLASECSTLIRREVAIKLAESVAGLTNAGDVLDGLTGQWIELVEGRWLRATALLKGSADQVWSPDKRKICHVLIHDAIAANNPLSPSEAAALVFHAYLSSDQGRLAHTAMSLQILDETDAQREVERHLLWLPFVALEAGQQISDDALASAALRGLQFRAAVTLDTDSLAQISFRWAEDIERVAYPEAKPPLQSMMWLTVGCEQSLKVPLICRLRAAAGLPTLPQELLDINESIAMKSFDGIDDLPDTGTTSQLVLAFASRCVRNAADLRDLLNWLDGEATDELRCQFDEILDWPIVQTLGAFVHGAWSAKSDEEKDWQEWLKLFDLVYDYALRRDAHRFGREAAKAKALILTEYLSRSDDALSVLEQAETDFGSSAVLIEQRANVYFQVKNDAAVLELWDRLTNGTAGSFSPDPFAYRRAGISAARLKRWDVAARIFQCAAGVVPPESKEATKFGLLVDAALATSRGGDQAAAVALLTEAVLTMPLEAAHEGDLRWEAVQRFAVAASIEFKNRWLRIHTGEVESAIGDASSPSLNVPQAVPGQAARTEYTKVQVLHLAALLGARSAAAAQELISLGASKFILVRTMAAEARLSLALGSGAGIDFVEAVLAYDQAMAEILGRTLPIAPLEADDGPPQKNSDTPEQWYGFLIAGLICCGPNLVSHLRIWRDTIDQHLGGTAVLTTVIRSFLQAAEQSGADVQDIVKKSTDHHERMAAAAKWLLEEPGAAQTFHLQKFMLAALLSDASIARQELFNHHVARCLAKIWRIHAQNPFQLRSPRTSVPLLLLAVDGAEQESGGIQSVIAAASGAVGLSLDSRFERLL